MTEDDGEKQEKEDIFRRDGSKGPGARADRPASGWASCSEPQKERQGLREAQTYAGTLAARKRITNDSLPHRAAVAFGLPCLMLFMTADFASSPFL